MSKVTFVSALFDIDRVDGRKWDNYLKWFDITLKLKVPMVLFITEDLVEFVEVCNILVIIPLTTTGSLLMISSKSIGVEISFGTSFSVVTTRSPSKSLI